MLTLYRVEGSRIYTFYVLHLRYLIHLVHVPYNPCTGPIERINMFLVEPTEVAVTTAECGQKLMQTCKVVCTYQGLYTPTCVWSSFVM